jgi:hypothetical protein
MLRIVGVEKDGVKNEERGLVNESELDRLP